MKTKTNFFLAMIVFALSVTDTIAQDSYRNVSLRTNCSNNGVPHYRELKLRPGAHPQANNNQTPFNSYNQTSQPSTNYQTPLTQVNNTNSESWQSVYDRLFQVNVYAVVVGVSNYIYSQHNLLYPAYDAYCFYNFLTSDVGGNIPPSHIKLLLNENATLEKIKLAMNTVFQNAGPNDVVYFYFSGHGGEKGYFLTYDERALEYSLIDNSFNLSKAKNKICIADACFSGENKNVKTTSLPYDWGVLNSAPSMPKLMSSKADEVSIENSGLAHGVFTYYLIEGLKGGANINGDDIITITELYNYVKTNVARYTYYKQNPVLNGITDPRMPMAIVKK